MVELVKHLRSQGHAIKHIDLGGGLGIPYDAEAEAPPSPGAYGRMVTEVLGDLDCSVIFEPGRMIAGNAGLLITEMLYEKTSDTKKFYIVDAAMNDLARPAMYDAHHEIISVQSVEADGNNTVDIVGPVCESSDVFAKDRNLPEFQAGDLLAIKSAGAYGAVMASTYNTRPMVPEVLVKDDAFAVIRKRQSLEELIALDNVPDWLSTEE